MSNTQRTEKEVRERKAKAILALKFGTVEEGTLAYWRAKADAEETI